MSGHTVIADTSETILSLLRTKIGTRDETDITAEEIVLASPDDVSPDADVRLSLFPYKVSREERGGSPSRVQTGENTFKNPPLLLTGHYLLTAYPASTAEKALQLQEQQTALGLAMQVFHDNSMLEDGQFQGALQDVSSFQLSMNTEATEEIERLWSSFVDGPLKPSVIYEAGPIPLESTKEEEVTRVSERDVDVDRKNR